MFEVVDLWTDEVLIVYETEEFALLYIKNLAESRGENEGNWDVRYAEGAEL